MKQYFFSQVAVESFSRIIFNIYLHAYQIVLVILTFFLVVELQTCTAIAPFFPTSSSESLFTPQNLAVIVNRADPLSVAIATYYQQQRGIPAENMISIEFPPGRPSLSPDEFTLLKAQVDSKTPASIQGYALTWAAPYRVDCMSITTAFAAGFDQSYCAQGCQATKLNPYFNTGSFAPYTDFQLRPTMAIAATSFNQAKALIDRGVAADGTYPSGTAYLMDTSDSDRNIRAFSYSNVLNQVGLRFNVLVLRQDVLEGKSDVMFYFTGLSQVENIRANRFLPGAIADHVTSSGGELTDTQQMSSLRWLEAGATGSYGSVVEPCNFPQKFPDLRIVMPSYLSGHTLLEAYWKSVAWAGQGIFIGEPLARPFGRS
jgi:uncharacterized protein (TIGR03790 family)